MYYESLSDIETACGVELRSLGLYLISLSSMILKFPDPISAASHPDFSRNLYLMGVE